MLRTAENLVRPALLSAGVCLRKYKYFGTAVAHSLLLTSRPFPFSIFSPGQSPSLQVNIRMLTSGCVERDRSYQKKMLLVSIILFWVPNQTETPRSERKGVGGRSGCVCTASFSSMFDFVHLGQQAPHTALWLPLNIHLIVSSLLHF